MATTTLVQRYDERAGAPLFLASFFRTPQGNMVTSEKVKIHVRRFGRKIAIALTTIDENGRHNKLSEFTEKEFTPAAYKENLTIPVGDLWNQEYGKLETDTVDYAAFLSHGIELALSELNPTLRRAVELQCAQVLSTGTLDLIDEVGTSRFVLDYSPKPTHFVPAGTTWASSTTKVTDLANLQEVIRVDGKRTVKHCVFGRTAFQDFLADDQVNEILNSRRMDRAEVTRPRNVSEDASWHGTFTLDHNEVNLWTYSASYDHPQTGADTRYVVDDHVIMLPEAPELDLKFAAVPRMPKRGVGRLVPNNILLPEKGVAFDAKTWLNEDETALTIQLAIRALAIPTAIDTFGRLDTRP